MLSLRGKPKRLQVLQNKKETTMSDRKDFAEGLTAVPMSESRFHMHPVIVPRGSRPQDLPEFLVTDDRNLNYAMARVLSEYGDGLNWVFVRKVVAFASLARELQWEVYHAKRLVTVLALLVGAAFAVGYFIGLGA